MEPACATGCGAGQPPQGTGDTAFRRAERLFKQRNGVPPDTSAILSRSAPAAASGQPVHLADHAGHPGIPQGAYFLPGLLTEAEELLLARQALCVYPDPALPHDSNLKQLAKLQQTPAATPGPQAAGGARPAGGVQSTPCAGGTVLHTKALRWVTVGYFYNWTEKTYDRGVASPFPPELAEIAQRKYQQVRGGVAGLPEGVDFQCAIINYYNAKSTLMGHTDTYEAPEVLANPLLTISVGRSAVFLLGGLTRDVPPVPILLRSGDAVLLVGEARSAFHGVPCVLPRSCPAHLLESFPILEAHRVNFSLRQVFPAEGGGGGGVDDADPACVEASPPVKRVEKHTTPAAVLDCIALSLMTVADHKVPDTIGKRESTEKVDVVCERGCSGGYTAGRRFTMAVSPRKDSGSDDARSSTPDRDSETKSLPPSPGMSPLPTQPTTPKSIKVRVHCPTLFHRIARAFGTSIADIAGSLQACALLDHVNEGPVCSELASPGKGGSRFYFFGGTALKSLTEAEGNSLKALLPGFLQHVTENPETLLPRYTSWVTVSYRNSMNSKVTERYALFNNIVVSPRVVPQLYDIKGSTFLRDGGSTMTSAVSPGETVTVLKDNELKSRIASHPEADKVLNTLAADVGFLEMNKLVDYSLLFGVRPVAPLSEAVGRAENGILSTNGDEVYYLGLIDILQSYTCSKALETCFKGVIASEDDISVIPPTAYATRFIRSASRLLGFDLS